MTEAEFQECTATARPARPLRSARATPRLAVVDCHGRTRFVALPAGETTVGRDRRCGVVLDDRSVSRRHCAIGVSHARVTLADLGSRNGTYLDDRALDPHAPEPLEAGAVIEAGTFFLKYVPDGVADSYLHLRVAGFSVRDGLTGLANRTGFDAALDAACARATTGDRTFALVLCDIDGFKAANDRHGHAAGDAVLRDVAGILQAHTRDDDAVCRYGGDEFAILLPRSDLAGGHRTAERLRAALEAGASTREPRATASFGVAAWSPGTATPDALVRTADERLYAAKAAGRNRVVSGLTRR
ncbi:MAG: GGDEF domain-containing protein [Acidimicrobiia bacterium]